MSVSGGGIFGRVAPCVAARVSRCLPARHLAARGGRSYSLERGSLGRAAFLFAFFFVLEGDFFFFVVALVPDLLLLGVLALGLFDGAERVGATGRFDKGGGAPAPVAVPRGALGLPLGAALASSVDADSWKTK